MAVSSPGSYGIPKGTMYSFPVTIANGKWSIVDDLAIDDFTRKKMIDALRELKKDAAVASSAVSG